jgi:Omp85 superfamily domain
MPLLVAAFPVLASAQDESAQGPSRTAALAAERENKATDTSAPRRSFIERALYRYDNSYGFSVFGNWHGVHLAGGDFPAGAGTKFGIGFDHAIGASDLLSDPGRPNRFDISAKAAYSTRGYARAVVAANARNLGGRSVAARVYGQYYEFPQEDFFGLGRDSQKDDRSDYLLRSGETGAVLQWKPVRFLDVSGGLSYLSPRIGSGTDSRFPSTERAFDPATLPGLTRQTDFLRSDATVALDWRDSPLHPHAGGLYSAQLSTFRDQKLNAFDFQRVEMDVQQYVPISNRYRTLALRASAILTDAEAGQQVPFFYQPTLGGSHTLRGFREFRFRDGNSVAMTAEYRWEAWWALDGALFVDAGTVAANRRDLTFHALDVSYGVGFRVHSNSAFVARLDLAFSREGFIPLLRFEHVF